jgi:hypothetical protein
MLQRLDLQNNPLEQEFLNALSTGRGLVAILEVLQDRAKVLREQEAKRAPSPMISSIPSLFPEGHAPLDNLQLLEQIQLGLKLSLNKLQQRPLRQSFLENDFLRKSIFNIKGSQGKQGFVFRSYMDEVFRNLRMTRYGIDEGHFLQAMVGHFAELGVSGRSGSFLYQTACQGFIVKTIPTKESQFLRKIMKAYYHVSPFCFCF